MFSKLSKTLLTRAPAHTFSTHRVLSGEYYNKIFEETLSSTSIRSTRIENKDKKGKVTSIIDLYGIPIRPMPQTEQGKVPEQLNQIISNQEDTVSVVQMDPTKYLYMRRKAALAMNVKGMDIEKLLVRDPIYPLNWEELIVENEVLQMARTKPAVEVEEAKDKEDNKDLESSDLSTEKGLKEFGQSLEDVIFDKRKSPYYEINNVLVYECLMQNKVVLSEVPQILHRMIVGNSLSLSTIQEMFKMVCSQIKTVERDLHFSDASLLMYPDIFHGPEDIYMTLLLRDIAESNKKFRAFVGIDHVDPIVDLWDSDILRGMTFENVLGLPDKMAADNTDTLLEKHAILDVMLEENVWNLPYLKNMFPYLREEDVKTEESLKEVKKKYFIFYKRYSELKAAFVKPRGEKKVTEKA